MSDLLRLAMWSGPRNISTAMMRSFENRPDTIVVDEPLYGPYLAMTGQDHPMADQVIDAQGSDWRTCVDALTVPVLDQVSVQYEKHMTHHLLPAMGRSWIDAVTNCFLIRDPVRVAASYAKRRDRMDLDDLGIRQQAEIFDRVAQRLGHAPPVIDAADVLEAPESALRALCEAVGIAFDPAMLRWPPGRRDSDGVWAPHWYESVWASTGFSAPSEPDGDPTPPSGSEELLAEAIPIYGELRHHRLTW